MRGAEKGLEGGSGRKSDSGSAREGKGVEREVDGST